MSNWKSMGSAPKDGTPVLIRDDYGEMFVAKWKDASSWHNPNYDWVYGVAVSDFNEYLTVDSPKEWQELPD